MKIYFHRRKVNLKEIDIYKIREIFCGRKMRKNLWKLSFDKDFQSKSKGRGEEKLLTIRNFEISAFFRAEEEKYRQVHVSSSGRGISRRRLNQDKSGTRQMIGEVNQRD